MAQVAVADKQCWSEARLSLPRSYHSPQQPNPPPNRDQAHFIAPEGLLGRSLFSRTSLPELCYLQAGLWDRCSCLVGQRANYEPLKLCRAQCEKLRLLLQGGASLVSFRVSFTSRQAA